MLAGLLRFGCRKPLHCFLHVQRKKYELFSSAFTLSSRKRQPQFSLCFSTLPTYPSTNSSFVTWYLKMIKSRPVLTKSVTASLIFMAADISSQMITLDASTSLDIPRTFRMSGYGLLISGPSLHLWFNYISSILPKRDVINIMKKIILGQTVFGPIMTVVFFSLNAALQGENHMEIAARLGRDLVPTFKNGLMYWPLCDFITFRFVPVHLQPLISNSFAFLWTIYITYMASLKKVDVDISAELS